MQATQNTPADRAWAPSLTLLNQHLAAAVILQDRMRRSPRNLRGDCFIMVDAACNQVASLMESCAAQITVRLVDLGGSAQWPGQLGTPIAAQRRETPSPEQLSGQLSTALSAALFVEPEPLDAFGHSVRDAIATAQAFGDTSTAAVMEQIWRQIDAQLQRA
jgi:DNA-binding ferritin-like protein